MPERADLQHARGSRWRPRLRAPSSITPRRHRLQVGERDVVLDVLVEDQPQALAVLGDIGDAVAIAFWIVETSISRPSRAGLPRDVAAIGAAEHAHREFGAAGAHQAGDADDLAAVDMQADALDHLAAGVQRMLDAPVFTSNTVSPICGSRGG
jgi:hypothetical protein